MEEDNQEKTEEPSQYRIEEFRSKGQVATSKELISVLIISSAMLTLVLSSFYLWEVLSEFFRWILGFHHEFAFTDRMIKIIIYESSKTVFKCIFPTFLSSMAFGVLSNVLQFGLIFTTEPLKANWERVNPIAGLKRIFSVKAISEVVKGIFKLVIIIFITYFILKDGLSSFNGLFQVEFWQTFVFGKALFLKLAFSIMLGLGVLALMDFGWEKFLYRKKLLQSKQQLKEEHKEKEGSPEIKQRIRSIQREMALKRMMKDVPKADVIITNPTHYSIALRYDPKKMVAPVLVAKGVDHLAMKIREIAKANNVPMVENKVLARTLYKTVKIGEAIPRSLYKAVAEILAYVFKLRKKRKI